MKLVAIDLDGTLLSREGTISEENVKAVREAQKHGVIIAIATGRSLHDTQQILIDAGLVCPIIAGNGAIVFHKGELLENLIIREDVLTEMRELLEKNNFYYEIYTKKGIFILRGGSDLLYKDIEEMNQNVSAISSEEMNAEIDIQYNQYGLQHVPDFQNIDITDLDVYKLFVLTFNKSKMEKLRGKLMGRKDISLTTSGSAKLELGHPETSKGNALIFLADHLGIPIEKTVAIGDNLNDLSMFETAGMSIAMGNAEAEVKKMGTYITTNHDEDGVAEALRKYILA